MIKLVNVSKFYHNEGNVVLGLHRANLEFKMREFVAITGESGSGKSTLLNVISGIDSYEEGELYFNGKETSHYDESDWAEYRKNNIGFVFQNYNLIDSYTVLENVESVMIINGVPKKERRRRAIEILKQVGLERHLRHRGTKLSGGEKQRLAIARAIAKDTPVIVADEPTGNLDSETGKQIVQILKELSKNKLVIMVTHNYDLIEGQVSRVVRLFDGKVVEDREIEKPIIEYTFIPHKQEVSSIKKAFPFAFWNIKRQPKITFLSLFVTLLTTFIVSFLFTSLLSNKLSTNFVYNRFFPNSTRERIIVKKDGPFTENELSRLRNISNVSYIIEEDLIYNQGGYYISGDENNQYYHALFSSISEINEKDLYGDSRLPKSDFEVVLEVTEDDLYLLNKTIEIEPPVLNYDRGLRIPYKYTVVGVIKIDLEERFENHIYFTQNQLDFLNRIVYTTGNIYTITVNRDKSEIPFYTLIFKIDNSLENGHIKIETNNANDLSYLAGEDITISSRKESFNFKLDSIIDYNKDDYSLTIIISINQYDFELMTNDVKSQVSVYVKNYSLVNHTIKQIEDLGYVAFNPMSQIRGLDIFTTILNLIITVFYGGLIFAVYLIAFVIIRAIFTNKLRDSLILKSMGLDSTSTNLITIIQISSYFVISIILLYIAVFLLTKYPLFKYIYLTFHWYHYPLLLLINLVLGVFVAYRVNRSIANKSILTALKAE